MLVFDPWVVKTTRLIKKLYSIWPTTRCALTEGSCSGHKSQ